MSSSSSSSSSSSASLLLPSTVSTVANYEGRASSFTQWAWGSEAAAASHIRDLFLEQLSKQTTGAQPTRVLDVGCGPGRDVLAFSAKGCFSVGIEPSPAFCQAAVDAMKSNGYSDEKFKIFEGDICDGALVARVLGPQQQSGREEQFDGAFCLASLFHIPVAHLPRALANIKALLRPGGLLLTTFSLPAAAAGEVDLSTHEGAAMSDGRWKTPLSHAAHRELLAQNGFAPLGTAEGGEAEPRIYNGLWTCVMSRAD
jgi:SAM-dependent methyltransferase